jgi:hypothetical protein
VADIRQHALKQHTDHQFVLDNKDALARYSSFPLTGHRDLVLAP